jgi:hypothetical protein
MSGNDLFADERIQFFLQNREDIKTWAAIEADVTAATRELLARSQPAIEERLIEGDARVVVGRHDSGQWERIIARHEHWPAAVGLTLEWHRNVDPTGTNTAKLGVFWWADPAWLEEPRKKLIEMVDRQALQGLGYKVPLEGVWPVGGRAPASEGWWHDPDAWVATIVDRLDATWPLVAHAIDALLPDEPQVIRG